jgi:hypothetical protein
MQLNNFIATKLNKLMTRYHYILINLNKTDLKKFFRIFAP